MPEIYLIRHGETESSLSQIYLNDVLRQGA
jgi:broad specificity phosphatase PhoE